MKLNSWLFHLDIASETGHLSSICNVLFKILVCFWCAEKGSGRLTLADLEIASTLHDFSWSNLELQDMIQFFDSNHDGMVSCLSCSNRIGAIDNLHVHITCFACPRSHGICSGTMVYGNS